MYLTALRTKRVRDAATLVVTSPGAVCVWGADRMIGGGGRGAVG